MVMSEDIFLLSHRKELALAAIAQGADVTLVAKDTGKRAAIEALGIRMIDLPVNPTGMNLRQELGTLRFLRRLYRKEQPDVIHHVGLKSVLWGSLAAKLSRSRALIINAITGLGITFSGEQLSRTARMILRVIRFSCRRKRAVQFIFQNHDDEALFLRYHVTRPDCITFIKGSGVDLQEFAETPIPESSPVKVLFTARMVEEKGVVTLVEAAEQLRAAYAGRVQFLLCGGLSKNPKAISQAWLESHTDGDYIQWLGYRTDVRNLLADCHIVAFPSYYREGIPKSLIEACAIGRPIVTCDSVGCREAVDEGQNGFLIPPKASAELADRLQRLIDDSALRVRMGACSRRKAEAEFAIEEVVRKHLELYAGAS